MRERVRIVEVLRGLNERDFRIDRVAQEAVENIWQRNMVRVELENELPARDLERVVEISRFGVRVPLAADVPETQGLGHRLDLVALAIIEHVGLVWISDRAR